MNMMNMKNLIPWNRSTQASQVEESSPLLSLHRQMNRLFDDFFRDFDLRLPRNGWSLGWPSVEVKEDDKAVRIVAELPGLEEKDIDVSLRDGVLTLRGEKKAENDNPLYNERWHGQFSRSFDVGSEVDPDKVSASFKNGVLTVTLEKLPETQSRTRKIAISHQG
jgi:HSP20 family protein